MSEISLTVGIYTLGCKVNQYESEAIAEALEVKGFTVLKHSEKCDIYIINTCTVTAESDRKARQFIRRAVAKNTPKSNKKTKPPKYIKPSLTPRPSKK